MAYRYPSPRGFELDHVHDPVRAPFLRLIDYVVDFFILFWLFNSAGALFPLLVQGTRPDMPPEGAAMLRYLTLPNVAMAPILFALRFRDMVNLLTRNLVLVALLLWVAASIAWSVDPGITGRRVVAFTANTLIACYFVVAYDTESALRRLLWVCALQLFLSVAFALAIPSLGFMEHLEGELRGIFTHKNALGQCLIISGFAFALALRSDTIPRAQPMFGLLLVAALSVPTGSATATLLLGLLALLHLLPTMLSLPRVAAAAVILFTLAIGSLFLLAGILFIEEIMTALGRDLTLTGRTELWAYVLQAIADRPLLGYGYFAFFEISWVATYTKEVLKWTIPHAHNGYLELLLGLGIPGFALTMIFLVRGLVQAMRGMGDPRNLTAWFGIFWITLYLGRNISESDFLQQSSTSWPLAVYAVLCQSYRPPSSDGAVERHDHA